MSSKRQSILPAVDRSGPKPPVNFSSSITISDNAVLQGTHSITIQAETVLHPRCRLETNSGSVLLGRRCIVQERVHIGALPENLDSAKRGGVAIGDYAMIEVGSVIEAGDTEIAEGTTVQVGCRVGSGARIGKNCTITHMTTVAPGDVIPDNTVLYSNGNRRIDRRNVTEMRKLGLMKQISMLRKMIPSNPEKFR